VRLRRLLILLIIAAAGPLPAAASSGGSTTFTVSGGPAGPVPLQPGVVTGLTFTVTDTGSGAETIDAQATGLFFKGDTPQFTGHPSPGLAVTVSPQSLSLAAGASQDVRVTMSASPGSRPGGLYAGVVFSNVPPSQAGEVNVVTAQARPLFGHVPGPTDDSGRIISFQQQPSTGSSLVLQASFLDTGNIDYELTGSMTVLASTGDIATVTLPARLVLPGNTRTFPIDVTPPTGSTIPRGPYSATLHLLWGVSAEHSGDARAPLLWTIHTPDGVGPPGASTTLAPTFIGRPLTPVPHHPATHNPGRHRGVTWTTWLLRFLDLLLLLLLILLLIALWSRERERERRGQQQGSAAGLP